MGKISLFRFFVITVVLAAAIIFLELSFVVMGEYRRTLLDSAMLNTEQVAGQTAATLDIYVREMKDDLKLLNRELQSSVSRNDVSEYMHAMAKIQTKLVAALVFDENGQTLECGIDNVEIRGDITESASFFPELFEGSPFEPSAPHEQNMLRGVSPRVITLGVRLMPSIYRRKAYLAADVRIPSLFSFIDGVNIGADGYCFVVDGGGNTIYHPADRVIDIPADLLTGAAAFTSGDRFVSVSEMNNCSWKVVGVSYTDKMITGKIFSMLRFIVLSMVFCVVVVIMSAYAFFRSVHKPLKELSGDIETFGRDTLSLQKREPSGVSEIRDLSGLFGQMAERVHELTERIKGDEEILRKTELRALQAQINPHFLYNTLDSVQWMCERGENKLAVDMIGALAKLFRISISKGEELIPISREIEHAKSYLVIQRYRFKDSFVYSFNIDKEILNYMCVKITLQPIIENAIIHGLCERGSGGEITVTGTERGDVIALAVTDNGAGIPPEKLGDILTADPKSDFGIGLRNINDRIKIHFGGSYGLTVVSEEDAGTTVTVFLPKTFNV